MKDYYLAIAGLMLLLGAGNVAAQTYAQNPRQPEDKHDMTYMLYGSVDLGVNWVNNDNGVQHVQGTSGNYYPNRFGVRGRKPIDEVSAFVYNFELGYSSSAGTLAATPFRLSNVGLEGEWGSVKLGRQYTFTYSESPWKSVQTLVGGAGFGISGGNGTAVMLNSTDTVNNAFQYRYPITKSLAAAAMYAFGSQAAGKAATDLKGWTLTYNDGSLAGAYAGIRENLTTQVINASSVSTTGTQALNISGLPGSIGGGLTSVTGPNNVAYQFRGSRIDMLSGSYKPTPQDYAWIDCKKAASTSTKDRNRSLDIGYNRDVTRRLTLGVAYGQANIRNRNDLAGTVREIMAGLQYSLTSDNTARIYFGAARVTGSGAAGHGYFGGPGGATLSSTSPSQLGLTSGIFYHF